MTTFAIWILFIAVAALAFAVYAVYAGHNVLAKRLLKVERQQTIHAAHLRNHGKLIASRPSIIRGPRIGGRR